MTKKKRFFYDWKTGRMKDTQSNSNATSNMRIIERLINDACYSYEKKINILEKENEKLKNEIKMLKSTIARNEAYIARLTKKGKWTK